MYLRNDSNFLAHYTIKLYDITWFGDKLPQTSMVKTPWANELPQLGLELGAPCCKSDALPNELKGYPTSPMLVGRRISIPLHSPPFYWTMFALEHVRVDFFLGHDLPKRLAFFLTRLHLGRTGTSNPNYILSHFSLPDYSWAGRARITRIATPHTGSKARSVNMVKTPWANELPQLGLEPGVPCCKSDALPNELKGYPTSPMLVGRRISIPLHQVISFNQKSAKKFESFLMI
jgi:hypothetical protein